MKLHHHLIKFIRDCTLPQQTLGVRQEWLASVKTARVVSGGLGAFSFGLAILNAYNQHLFPTLGFLALSYASYECYRVSDNIRTILKNPGKELQTVFHSTKKLVRLVTDEAPITRKMGEYYLTDPEIKNQKPKPILAAD
jgi:hypothetical protein